MLRIVATVGSIALALGLVVGSFYLLKNVCSSNNEPRFMEQNGSDKNSERARPSENNPAEKPRQSDPSATFDLRVTEPNRIEGKYYALQSSGNEGGWMYRFFCDTKLGEFAVVCLTFFLVIFTALLWHSTEKLWSVTRDNAIAAKNAAIAAQRQATVTATVEGPLPLILGFNLVQYEQIPGETSITDPVPPGPIPPNCRILFCIENKGRTPLRLIDLCVEKFAGISLPATPTYTNVIQWGLVLEKGPIWIRPSDEQSVVNASDLEKIATAYPEGSFWVFGYFTYWNLLDERVQHKFLARWDLQKGFVGENRPGYT